MTEKLQFPYTNYAGKYGIRTVEPIRIYFGATEWHPEPQWFLEAFDIEKQAVRDFAFSGIGNADGKIGQAYQVVGLLLDKTGDFVSEEGQRALNYFSDEKAYDDDFLPWPRGDHEEWMKAGKPDANAIALSLLDKIDEINAATHPGGDVQRRAAIQVAIRDAIEGAGK